MFGHIPRSSHKFVYVRGTAVLADDQDQTTSVCFPVSAIRGFVFSGSTSILLRYECPFQFAIGDNDDNDGILFTISVSGGHRTFIDDFVEELSFGESQFIILNDGVTGETFSIISASGITSNIGAD